jgi:hypothetical protein
MDPQEDDECSEYNSKLHRGFLVISIDSHLQQSAARTYVKTAAPTPTTPAAWAWIAVLTYCLQFRMRGFNVKNDICTN